MVPKVTTLYVYKLQNKGAKKTEMKKKNSI